METDRGKGEGAGQGGMEIVGRRKIGMVYRCVQGERTRGVDTEEGRKRGDGDS